MSKKLRIEELSVDSFEVSGEKATQRGTVEAHSAPYQCYSGTPSCIDTCQDTCGLTCYNSCWCSRDETCTCA